MGYEVRCECGKAHAVSAADAGVSLRCDCGRTVEVPPLHKLRTAAGEDALSPVIRLRALLLDNQLPGTDHCACCRRSTTGLAHATLKCEWAIMQESVSKSERAAGCLLLGAYGLFPFSLLYLVFSQRKPIEHGQDVELTVPVRVCESCRPQLADPPTLRQALDETPDYAAVLDRYPNARIVYRG